MNLTGILGHIVSTTGVILAFLIFPHPTPTVTPPAPVTPPVQASSYVVTEHYTYDGHTVAASIFIPKSGGEVSGKISGDCNGTVTGTYDGGDNGKIQGTIQATCHVYFVWVPVSGTYSGTVDTQNKKVDLLVDAKADRYERSQKVSLSLH